MIVIARYNEDVQWVSGLTVPYIIYNKGDGDFGTKLSNTPGLDSHTYLHHIVNNYDSLTRMTVFTQADPYSHCPPNVIELFNRYAVDDRYPFVSLCNQVVIDDCQGNPLDGRIIHRRNNEWRVKNGLKPREWKPLAIERLVQDVIGLECPHKFCYGPGQIFAVRDDVIRRRTLEFYARLLKETSERRSAPAEMERIWSFIFSK